MTWVFFSQIVDGQNFRKIFSTQTHVGLHSYVMSVSLEYLLLLFLNMKCIYPSTSYLLQIFFFLRQRVILAYKKDKKLCYISFKMALDQDLSTKKKWFHVFSQIIFFLYLKWNMWLNILHMKNMYGEVGSRSKYHCSSLFLCPAQPWLVVLRSIWNE